MIPPRLRTLLGGSLATVGVLGQWAVSEVLTAPVRISGLLNPWPPAVLLAVPFLLAAALAAAGLWFGRISAWGRAGFWTAAGATQLATALRNLVISPPREGRNDTAYVAAEVGDFWLAAVLGLVALGVAAWNLRRRGQDSSRRP